MERPPPAAEHRHSLFVEPLVLFDGFAPAPLMAEHEVVALARVQLLRAESFVHPHALGVCTS